MNFKKRKNKLLCLKFISNITIPKNNRKIKISCIYNAAKLDTVQITFVKK